MDIPLSNHDLNKYIKEVEEKGLNMFLTNHITPKTNIEDIFSGSGHCILFHDYPDDNSPIGHWITMLRNHEGEYFFLDSYGKSPEYYDKDIIKCLANNKNNGVKSLIISNQKLQGNKSNTCGRYGIVFVSLHKKGFRPDQTIEFLKEGGKKAGSIDKFILGLFDDKKK